MSMFRGNRSYIPDYTEHNVYLTTDHAIAKSYAVAQVKHEQANGIKSSPVVLEVTIPDPSKLISDDDYVNKNGTYHYWSQLSKEQRLIYPPKLVKSQQFGGSVADLARERAAHEPYTRSLKYNESVAYRGRIPARFLKVLD